MITDFDKNLNSTHVEAGLSHPNMPNNMVTNLI